MFLSDGFQTWVLFGFVRRLTKGLTQSETIFHSVARSVVDCSVTVAIAVSVAQESAHVMGVTMTFARARIATAARFWWAFGGVPNRTSA